MTSKQWVRMMKHGANRCWRCGRRFKRNEERFRMYPPVLGGECVCKECKEKEV